MVCTKSQKKFCKTEKCPTVSSTICYLQKIMKQSDMQSTMESQILLLLLQMHYSIFFFCTRFSSQETSAIDLQLNTRCRKASVSSWSITFSSNLTQFIAGFQVTRDFSQWSTITAGSVLLPGDDVITLQPIWRCCTGNDMCFFCLLYTSPSPRD